MNTKRILFVAVLAALAGFTESAKPKPPCVPGSPSNPVDCPPPTITTSPLAQSTTARFATTALHSTPMNYNTLTLKMTKIATTTNPIASTSLRQASTTALTQPATSPEPQVLESSPQPIVNSNVTKTEQVTSTQLVTQAPTTPAPSTVVPTTPAPTTVVPTTVALTTQAPSTVVPTTPEPKPDTSTTTPTKTTPKHAILSTPTIKITTTPPQWLFKNETKNPSPTSKVVIKFATPIPISDDKYDATLIKTTTPPPQGNPNPESKITIIQNTFEDDKSKARNAGIIGGIVGGTLFCFAATCCGIIYSGGYACFSKTFVEESTAVQGTSGGDKIEVIIDGVNKPASGNPKNSPKDPEKEELAPRETKKNNRGASTMI